MVSPFPAPTPRNVPGIGPRLYGRPEGRIRGSLGAPGGGVEPHSSLPDNLMREVHEETGLSIAVGAPVMVNEFHSPERNFHQVEVFFRAEITDGVLDDTWRDPEAVVTKRRFFARDELSGIRARPAGLAEAAWDGSVLYDALEPMLR